MTINKLKKELGLSNTDIAGFFGLSPAAYANSSAKARYEAAMCSVYAAAKSKMKRQEFKTLDWFFDKIKSHFEHGDIFESICLTYAIAKQKELDYAESGKSINEEKGNVVLPL